MVVAMAPGPEEALMKRLYDQGASIRDIAAACGRSPKTVHRHLTAAGVTFRSPGGGSPRQRRRVRLTPAQEQQIQAAYRAGAVSLDELGTAYGTSGDTIGRRLRRAGVPVRPRGQTIAAAPVPAGKDVLRLHRQGLPPRDIAARLHRGTAAGIARELRRAGITPHRRRPVPPPAELAVAYARAGSLRALSTTLRAGEDRLKTALEAAGVPAGSLRHVPPALRPEVARLAATGATRDQIAAQTGISADVIPQVGKPRQHAA
jgi:transposase